MNNSKLLKSFSKKEFFDFWEIIKSEGKAGDESIPAFFAPYVVQLPQQTVGPFYWQIFENAGPISKILYAGGAIEQLTITTREGLLNISPDAFFTFFHPDDVKPVFAFMAKIFALIMGIEPHLRIRQTLTIYMRMKTKSGVFDWFSMQYPALLFGTAGDLTHGLVVYTHLRHLSVGLTKPMLTVLDCTNPNQPFLSSYFADDQPAAIQQMPKLTKREKEIISFLGQGFSSKQIAGKLAITKNTVDNHRQRLLKKLNVRSSAELVRKVTIG